METLWKGEWRSNTYDVVYGDIEVLLKTSESNYDTSAYISYNGDYKSGARYAVPINVKPDESTFSGNIKFQTIRFFIMDKSDNEISGTYNSSNPSDVGFFTISPSSDKINERTREVEQCCIQ